MQAACTECAAGCACWGCWAGPCMARLQRFHRSTFIRSFVSLRPSFALSVCETSVAQRRRGLFCGRGFCGMCGRGGVKGAAASEAGQLMQRAGAKCASCCGSVLLPGC